MRISLRFHRLSIDSIVAACVLTLLGPVGATAQVIRAPLFASPAEDVEKSLVNNESDDEGEIDFNRLVEEGKAEAPKIEVTTKSIRELQVDIRPTEGEMPKRNSTTGSLDNDFSVVPGPRANAIAVHWKAPGNLTGRLYYDDHRVERHGMSSHPYLQPGLSTIRFLGNTALLPVKVVCEPPQDLVYVLGYGQPSYSWVSRELSPVHGN